MKIITLQADLDTFTADLQKASLVFLDTEFMRERTYYSKLCLLQAKLRGQEAVAIDPLAENLSLNDLLQALLRPDLLKVFHAGRQDLEIFYNLTNTLPRPIFDTQIAASFCGYQDQIGFEAIVAATTNKRVDKSSQFTDWARRPLSEKQIAYALDDVILLEQVYTKISADLQKRNRQDWVQSEFDYLLNEQLYQNDPMLIWQRIKIKRDDPRTLAILQELCAWREILAVKRDVPRGRIVKDETLAELALQRPKNKADLTHIRLMDDSAKGKYADDILAAIKLGMEKPDTACPVKSRRAPLTNQHTPALEMLKLLLKINAAETDLQPRLLASPDDLENFVLSGNHPAQGYKKSLFWDDAIALMNGNLSLSLKAGIIQKIRG